MSTMKVMKLIDPMTGKMVCKVCGMQHFANRKPDSYGQFYRGSWQCPSGCKIDKNGKHLKGDRLW